MSRTLTGMYIEKVPVSDEYPCGRRYVRQPIPNNRQSNLEKRHVLPALPRSGGQQDEEFRQQ